MDFDILLQEKFNFKELLLPIVANNGNGNPLKIISQAVDSVLKKHKKKTQD